MRAHQVVFKVAALAILVGAGAGAGMALGGLVGGPGGDLRGLGLSRPTHPVGPATTAAAPVLVPAAPAPPTSRTAIPAPLPAPGPGFRSPIYYQPLGGDVAELDAAMSASGARDFIFAFVLDAGGCRPAWHGDPSRPIGNRAADQEVAAAITRVRRAGGDVAVSFGGAGGGELGRECTTVRALADAYDKVVDAYRLTRIDLDYENEDLTTGIDKRMAAVRLVQDRARAAHRPIRVSLTLPVNKDGLSEAAADGIRAALRAGVRPEIVNVMAFDFHSSATPTDVVNAVETAHAQVKALFGEDDASAYARMGLQVMNGHSDIRDEQVLPDDMRDLVAYARSRHLGWLSFWSLNRDRRCPSPTSSPTTEGPWAIPTCSGVAQKRYEYASIVAAYRG